jgi:serine/threonine protein kinase
LEEEATMSYLRVKEEGADQSVNLREFLKHHGHTRHESHRYHNNSQQQVYTNIRVLKKLGAGSTGIAYKAHYRVDGEIMQCVVKLPIKLLNVKQIKLDNEGNIEVRKKEERGYTFQDASADLDYEWGNFLLLHFGKKMKKYGIGTKPEWSVSNREFQAVIDEANELKKVNGYNNIHRILVSDPAVPMLISEYFDGTVEEFSMILKKSGYEAQTEQIFECIIPQTLAGLHFMHSEGVQLAHMDIKPANMLYKFVAGQALVVLCDFGLCQPSEDVQHTYMGTPYFMAPEIDKKGTVYTPKYTDVYSWAVSMLCTFYPRAIKDAGDSLVDYLLSQIPEDIYSEFNYEMQKNVFKKILAIIEAENPRKRYKKFTNIYKMYYEKKIYIL